MNRVEGQLAKDPDTLAPGECLIGEPAGDCKVWLWYRCGRCKTLVFNQANVTGFAMLRIEYEWYCERCGIWCHTVGDN